MSILMNKEDTKWPTEILKWESLSARKVKCWIIRITYAFVRHGSDPSQFRIFPDTGQSVDFMTVFHTLWICPTLEYLYFVSNVTEGSGLHLTLANNRIGRHIACKPGIPHTSRPSIVNSIPRILHPVCTMQACVFIPRTEGHVLWIRYKIDRITLIFIHLGGPTYHLCMMYGARYGLGEGLMPVDLTYSLVLTCSQHTCCVLWLYSIMRITEQVLC